MPGAWNMVSTQRVCSTKYVLIPEVPLGHTFTTKERTYGYVVSEHHMYVHFIVEGLQDCYYFIT